MSNVRGIIILFFFANIFFWSKGQDILYLKDSSVINIKLKVIKVNFKTIDIYLSDSLKSLNKIDAKKVALIIYENGNHLVINRRLKCRVNFDFNMLANKLYSNWPYYHASPGQYFSGNFTEYSPGVSANKYVLGFNTGINFLLGRRKNTNFLISLNYTLSRSSFVRDQYITKYYENSYVARYYTHKHDTITSYSNFINFFYGPHFKIGKHFTLEFGASINVPFLTYNKISGYTSDFETGGITTTVYYKEKADRSLEIGSYLATFLKFGYDFTNNGNKYGAFFTINGKMFNDYVHANWFMAGIRYYPFKKYDQRIEKQ